MVEITHIGQIIKAAREAHRPKLSQTKLAKMIGISQVTMSKIEKGTQGTRHLRKILKILGIKVRDIPKDLIPSSALVRPLKLLKNSELSESVSETKHLIDNSMPYSATYDFPVYYSAGATSGQHGAVIVSADPVEYVERPAPLIKVKHSYGVRISGTSMEPAYWAGDVVFIHPYLPPVSDCDILLRAESHGEQRAMIKYLVSHSDTHWHVRQWNPAPGEGQNFSLLKSEWPKADRIVGKYNRR